MNGRAPIAGALGLGVILAAGLAGCAGARSGAGAEVKAVVLDEQARQAAQQAAVHGADGGQALDAAAEAATETATGEAGAGGAETAPR